MKDLETRLREEAARQRQHNDPGDAFWARLPGAVWEAYQAEAGRRQQRGAFLRLLIPIVTTCAGAAALLLVLRSHPQPVRAGRPFVVEPSSLDTAADELGDDALEQLARDLNVTPAALPSTELLEHWNVPVEVFVEQLNDGQLSALAEQLGRS